MGMIGMGNECYLYVNGISVSKPIWLHDTVCNGVQREHNKKLNNGLPILTSGHAGPKQ